MAKHLLEFTYIVHKEKMAIRSKLAVAQWDNQGLGYLEVILSRYTHGVIDTKYLFNIVTSSLSAHLLE